MQLHGMNTDRVWFMEKMCVVEKYVEIPFGRLIITGGCSQNAAASGKETKRHGFYLILYICYISVSSGGFP